MTFDDKLRCPSCGGHDIRQSRRHGLLDSVMTTFRRRPHRCRFCERRFYVSVAPSPAAEEDVEEQLKPYEPTLPLR